MAKLNKTALARRTAKRTGYTQRICWEIIDALFESIKDELAAGNSILIPKFGKFYMQLLKQRPVRDPRTLEDITLRPYKIIKFKQTRRIKDILKKAAYDEADKE